MIGYRDRGVFARVRMEGLEPPCREALDPKSSASTNFATSAFHLCGFYLPITFRNPTSANGVQRKEHFYTKAIIFV